MPSGRWKPETTPSAVSSASRLPEITSILVRQICSASAMKSLPFLASRQAAVASTHSRSTCMVSHSARKRLSAASAFSTASAASSALGLHLAAEAGQRLFVEQRRRTAGDALVDHEAHRVRTDVDDRRPAAHSRAGPAPRDRRPRRASQARSVRRVRLRGDDSLSDLPRPDRLGLVMKYLCALKGSSPGGRLDALRRAVRQQLPALLVVLEICDHDLVEHLLMHGRIEDRAQRLDAAVEIARHHVGGRDVDRGLRMRQAVAGAEAIDAAVLEEAADDRLDADVLGQARQRPAAGSRCRAPRDRSARRRARPS